MRAKHIPLDFKSIQMLKEEDAKIKKDKKVQQEEEKEGMDVIKKIQDNFKRFTSAAGGKILKYKEFWEANKESSGSFDESGDIYKMWDNDYVVGVLNLPDAALSADELNAEIELVDSEKEDEEPEEDKSDEKEELEADEKEETEEKEEEDTDANEWIRPKGYRFLLEKDKEGLGIDLGLEKEEEPKKKKEDGPKLGFDFGDKKDDGEGIELETGSENGGELEFGNDGETREFFVVFDMSGNDREEIFRTDNPKVIKSFKDFYENTFKAAVKEQIQKFKMEKEAKEAEAKAKAEEELKKQRKSKFEKFMKESFGEEAYEKAKKMHPEWALNEEQFFNDEEEYHGDVLDDLKANFRSWESDCDNEDSTLRLASILSDRHPEITYDEAYERAKDWTGYEEDLEEAMHWDTYMDNLKRRNPHWNLDNISDDEEDDENNDDSPIYREDD